MLSIRLQAYAPEKRRLRAYEVTLCADLFGAWIMERTYGRIGKQARSKIRSSTSWEDTRADLRAYLSRLASAAAADPRCLRSARRPWAAGAAVSGGAGSSCRRSRTGLRSRTFHNMADVRLANH